MRLVCVAVMLAGCDQAFGLDIVHALDAGDGTGCVMPSQSDTFDNGPACTTWGFTLSGSSGEKLVGGELVLDPKAANTNTGCTSGFAFAFGPSGVFVEVPVIGTGLDQYNGLQLFWTASRQQSDSSALTISHGTIAFMSHGSAVSNPTPYDPIAARWWRLRPSDDRMALIAEISPDGRIWGELGRELVPPPATCLAQIQSGLTLSAASTEMHVAGFDLCP